jgi:hypothetical protein
MHLVMEYCVTVPRAEQLLYSTIKACKAAVDFRPAAHRVMEYCPLTPQPFSVAHFLAFTFTRAHAAAAAFEKWCVRSCQALYSLPAGSPAATHPQ